MLICGEQVDNMCAEHSVTFKVIFFFNLRISILPKKHVHSDKKKNPRIIKIIVTESIWLRNRKFLNLSTIDIWGAPEYCRIHSTPSLYPLGGVTAAPFSPPSVMRKKRSPGFDSRSG